MTFTVALGIITFASLAGSFGWAMRGTKIGGEKGAMLPGALLGMIFARFSGSEIIRENFWVFSAVGALAMFYGGTETYGETLGFIVNKKPPENYAKGLQGVLLKGALWFGIFASFIGIAFNAMAGNVYKASDFIIFFSVLVPFRFLGILIFNHPLKPDEKKFPRFYFSKTRQEEWGGLLFILIALVVLMAWRRDMYSLMFAAAGAVSGSLGWALGINLFYLANFPLKSGRYFYGPLQKKGYIGGWKIMEFTLGAVGGLGTALYFCLSYGKLQEITAVIEKNGSLWNPYADPQGIAMWVSLVLILITSLQYPFQNAYNPGVKAGSKTDYIGKVFERLEHPFFSYMPLMFILMGSVRTAQLISFFVMFFVIVQKDFFERFIKHPGRWFWFIVLVGGGSAVLAGELLLPNSYSAWQTWLMYLVAYEFFELCWIAHENRRRAKEDKEAKISFFGRWRRMGEPLVHIYFAVQITALLIIGFFVFR